MRVLKFIGKAFLGLLALIIVGLFGLYLTDTTYYGRFARLPFADVVRDVDFYSPLEVVKGNPAAPLHRAPENLKTIRPEGWQAALDYALEMETFALVVWQGGAIQYEYYMPGFAPDARTDPASMSKSITGLVVGQLIADGLVKSVDDTVATYVSEWANDDRKKITIRNVLQMASGLDREPFSPSPFGQFMQLNLGTNIRDLTLSIQAGEEPGKVFSYYNFNSQMLAILVERVTGKRYAEYLSERLWSKIGAKDAYVFLDRENGLARTYCCLQASAEDWVRVGLLHLNKGKVGDTQVVSEDWMKQVITPSPTNPNYGFQTWLGTTYEEKRGYGKGVPAIVPQSEPFAAPDMIYFDGARGQRVYVIPSKDMVIVRTGRGGVDFKTGAFLWDESVIPNALINAVIPKEELASSNVFWNRFFNPPKDVWEPELSWYEPKVTVAGTGFKELIPRASGRAITVDKAALDEAERYAGQTKGNALIVVHNGVIQREKYWNGYSRDKVFSGHSMTKTVTALVVGKAIEEGFITSVDDPISKYITEWANDDRGKITIRNLLHMSSGLEPVDRSRNAYGRSLQQAWGMDIVGTSLSFPKMTEPNVRFDHDNVNPQLLGIIVERASKMPYAEYLSTRLWAPMGNSEGALPLDRDGGMPHTDCCLISRPLDWVNVGELIRNKGVAKGEQIISAAWIEEMLKSSPANANYGFQIWRGTPYAAQKPYNKSGPSLNNQSEPYLADDVYFLDGWGQKRTYVIPSRGLVIVRLGLFERTFDDAKLPNIILKGLKKS